IGGKTTEELKNGLRQSGMNISSNARIMLNDPGFTTQSDPEEIKLIRLKIGDLGITNRLKTEEVYQAAQNLGLELCPAEVGPHYSLGYTGKLLKENFQIAMKPITCTEN